MMTPAPANGPYVEAVLGGGSARDFQTFTSIVSLGGPDDFNPGTRQAGGGEFFGGVTVGTTLGSAPNPFKIVENEAPRPQDRTYLPYNYFSYGVQATFLGGAGGTTINGTPTTALGTLPGTDQYKTTDNFIGMFDLTATTFPFQNYPTIGLTARAGWGVVDKTVTYNCNGFCTLGGIAPFSQSQNVWMSGPTLGGSVLIPLVGTPITLTANFDYIFLLSQNLQFGTPATINPAFKLSQGDAIATVGARMPLSDIIGGPIVKERQ